MDTVWGVVQGVPTGTGPLKHTSIGWVVANAARTSMRMSAVMSLQGCDQEQQHIMQHLSPAQKGRTACA
jgi:hypothetical protein